MVAERTALTGLPVVVPTARPVVASRGWGLDDPLGAPKTFAKVADPRHESERGHDRQPEVEQSIGDDAEQSRRELESQRDQRQCEGDLDKACATGGEGSPGQHVAGRITKHDRRDREMGVDK